MPRGGQVHQELDAIPVLVKYHEPIPHHLRVPPDNRNAVTVGCDPDCKLELGLWCSRASRSNQMHWRLVDAALETCNSSTARLRVHMTCRDRSSWCGGMDSREHDMYGGLARAVSAAFPARADTRPIAALLRDFNNVTRYSTSTVCCHQRFALAITIQVDRTWKSRSGFASARK